MLSKEGHIDYSWRRSVHQRPKQFSAVADKDWKWKDAPKNFKEKISYNYANPVSEHT